ncbi:MAG: CehA/McbA family metallohydrolase [Candidatus Gastranaerophilales bacterium]|nr:CehA/McbA family metallohydrolase [Candidatus Gastranaerophilales bacterium]
MEYNYAGALHIHSTYSDGTRDIDYIISQAQKAGLKWIIITDHNDLSSLKHEGFYKGLCVIAGTEITPLTENHLLSFGVHEVINEDLGARNCIDEVHKQGGICFPAHPDESIFRKNKQKALRWNDWSIDTFDGLEIWNYLTDWTDSYSIENRQFRQYFSRHKMAKGPTKNVLAWWDRLNLSKDNIVPAIAGLDAHCFNIKLHHINFKISDYYDFFSSVNNIVSLDEPLSKTFGIAKQQILNALKSGNNIILNKRICNNTNVEFAFIDKDNKYYSGETAILGNYSYLNVKIPKKATIRLIHNGVLVYETEGKILKYDMLDLGKYRLEVYYNSRPYIFSNPIKIVKE